MHETSITPEPGEVVIVIESSPDSFGRQHFTTYWLDDNQWRGGSGISAQCSHAVVSESAQRHEGRGQHVRVVPLVGGGSDDEIEYATARHTPDFPTPRTFERLGEDARIHQETASALADIRDRRTPEQHRHATARVVESLACVVAELCERLAVER